MRLHRCRPNPHSEPYPKPPVPRTGRVAAVVRCSRCGQLWYWWPIYGEERLATGLTGFWFKVPTPATLDVNDRASVELAFPPPLL